MSFNNRNIEPFVRPIDKPNIGPFVNALINHDNIAVELDKKSETESFQEALKYMMAEDAGRDIWCCWQDIFNEKRQ